MAFAYESASSHALPGILLDPDEHRHAATFGVLATDQVTRTLGRDQGNINTLRRLDVAEANVEAVAEEQSVARHQVRLDRRSVDLALRRVRRQHHDQIGLLAGFVRSQHTKALGFGLRAALAVFRQADAYVDTGIAQRQRVCVALAAESQHGDIAALDQ